MAPGLPAQVHILGGQLPAQAPGHANGVPTPIWATCSPLNQSAWPGQGAQELG